MPRQKIAAIVPAFNEEKNVGKVLGILLKVKEIDEVILVDDGSFDNTATVGTNLGARVIRLQQNIGKGGAMKKGFETTTAPIVAFFDADLIGLSVDHVAVLLEPVLQGKATMAIGVRDRLFNLPEVIARIMPLFSLGGERVMERTLFEGIPDKFMNGFAIEFALNYYCAARGGSIDYVSLKGLNHIVKEKKWGFVEGFINRLKMMWEILKIAAAIFINRDFT